MSRELVFLRESQNTDGGWGYKRGGMSFVEPTAAAVLALLTDAQSASQVQRAREFLVSLQHTDGGWGIAAMDDESGWMTAWAVRALAERRDAVVERAQAWLLKASGIRITDPNQIQSVHQVLQIDPRVTGWSWQPGDAAWIFPTALTLLALDAVEVRDHPRVQEGIRYLLDRAIPTGGWNIGNPFMVTGTLPPTVECTTLALMALHTFEVDNDITSRARAYLDRGDFTPTAFEWAWRGLFWNHVGEPTDRARAALESLRRADGSFDGNVFTTALAARVMGELESRQ